MGLCSFSAGLYLHCSDSVDMNSNADNAELHILSICSLLAYLNSSRLLLNTVSKDSKVLMWPLLCGWVKMFRSWAKLA